ncbi:MAG: tetratricopeptide repeat protein [Flavobacteriaceae bacterium]
MRNILLFFILCQTAIVFGQENYKILMHKGNKNFDQKNYDEASQLYSEASQQKAKDFGSHYNLGNAFYRKEMYEDAIAQYEKSLENAKNENQRVSALYNMGNAYFQQGNSKKAVDSYKKALKLDPNNDKILHNLRIAQKKEEKKQNQSEKKSQKEQNQQDKDNQQQDIDRYSPEKDRFRKENNENKHEQDFENQLKKQEKREEEELLKQIAEREQHAARRALGSRGYANPRSNEKDW